ALPASSASPAKRRRQGAPEEQGPTTTSSSSQQQQPQQQEKQQEKQQEQQQQQQQSVSIAASAAKKTPAAKKHQNNKTKKQRPQQHQNNDADREDTAATLDQAATQLPTATAATATAAATATTAPTATTTKTQTTLDLPAATTTTTQIPTTTTQTPPIQTTLDLQAAEAAAPTESCEADKEIAPSQTPKKRRRFKGSEGAEAPPEPQLLAPDDGLEPPAPAQNEEEPVGDGQPGALVVPLPQDAGRMLLADDRKWLQHLEAVAEADVEVFSSEATDSVREGDGISEELVEVPAKLLVRSPNGQSECSGAYLLLEEKANGQPLWRKEAANRWLYSGTDGTWLVGGSKQQTLGFACRTGLLHLAKAHDGQTPDRVQGSWKRVDGKEWADDADIKVILPTPFRSGAPVQVVNSRRLQGRYGRLEAKHGNVWRTRLADGSTEDLEEEQLQ
ncbi:unnamed protein product, partial [Polarella glacialis]